MEEEREKYINTEFGKVPSDWRYCTFKDVLITFSSGATPYRAIAEYYKGKIRWISSGELNYNVIYDTSEHISEAALKNTNLKIHEPGTFLMAITGLEAEGTRGRCAIIGAPSTTNQSCLALNGTGKMTTDYLFWFYRQYGNYLAFKYCQGTKQQSYTAAIVKKLPICCPEDPHEQIAIATALSDTDALIAALDKKIAKKRQIKQGAMQQLLTGKKRLLGFSGEWVEKKLGDVAEIKDGTHQTPRYVGDGIPFYSVESVTNNDFTNTKKISIQEHALLTKSCKIEKGDVLMTRIGSIGVCKYIDWEVDASFYVSLALIKFKRDCSAQYFCHYSKLKEFQNEIEEHSLQFATPKKINLGKISLIKINIPVSQDEQTTIAQILTDMDNEIARLEKERDKYLQLKAGMMQVLLTGKVRLINPEN